MRGRDHILVLLTAAVILGLVAGYRYTATTVFVSIDGSQTVVHTHRRDVGGLLAELGIVLTEHDIGPPLSTPLVNGATVTIARARRVTVRVDNQTTHLMTHAATPAEVLSQIGVQLYPRDSILVNGQPSSASVALPMSASAQRSGIELAAYAPSARGDRQPKALTTDTRLFAQEHPPVTIAVQRAVLVTIEQDGLQSSVMTAAQVVGEALFNEGIYVYAADRVSPSLDTPVSSGMRISIRRAKPVTIIADGRSIGTRTQAETVAALLTEEGVAPRGKDYTAPALDAAVTPGLVVKVTRVHEETITESEGIPYKTVYQPDNRLELDQRAILTPGKQGIRKRTIRTVYEDGKQVGRFLDREWIDEEPTTEVIAFGTRIVVRALQTPDGPIEYWRMLRVWATYYTAATSGKERGHPQYGITRTGRWATKGIIAVDPNVIRLHTPMYVPGYGFGAAEDTGGLILGLHIDLCFDEDDPNPRHLGWVTVYLLTPVPDDIPWLLPDYPRER